MIWPVFTLSLILNVERTIKMNPLFKLYTNTSSQQNQDYVSIFLDDFVIGVYIASIRRTWCRLMESATSQSAYASSKSVFGKLKHIFRCFSFFLTPSLHHTQNAPLRRVRHQAGGTNIRSTALYSGICLFG